MLYILCLKIPYPLICEVKNITPKTEGQKYYVDSIRKNTITFGIGPAGTGKTFLAVALAAFYLKNRNVDKLF